MKRNEADRVFEQPAKDLFLRLPLREAGKKVVRINV